MSFQLLTNDAKSYISVVMFDCIQDLFNVKAYEAAKGMAECLQFFSHKSNCSENLTASYELCVLLSCLMEDYHASHEYLQELSLSDTKLQNKGKDSEMLMLVLRLQTVAKIGSGDSIQEIFSIMNLISDISEPNEELYYVFHEVLMDNISLVDVSLSLKMICNFLEKCRISYVSLCLEMVVSYFVHIYHHFYENTISDGTEMLSDRMLDLLEQCR